MQEIEYLPNYIEIETSSLCNRRCLWCPNGSFPNRNSGQKYMNWELFTKIILELKNLQFKGKYGVSNFNEPLLNDRLVTELDFIKENLPNSPIRIYTNGDFLNDQIFAKLIELEVSFLRVTVYPSKNLNENNILPSNFRIVEFLKKKNFMSLPWNSEITRHGLNYFTTVKATEFRVLSPDLRSYSYRGNTSNSVIKNYIREEPCYLTSYSATIDYLGNMKMCCNIFSETPEHKSYIIGNLKDDSFYKLWTSEKMIKWRINHNLSNWNDTSICQSCLHHSPPKPEFFSKLI